MDLTDLEMFLTIVNTKSISKTADALFLSQPTISHRLKMLEKELDFPLIVRSKGLKQIELTAEGTDFIPIAQRMVSLWKETRLLQRTRNKLPLTVGCADSVNVALLAPLYRELMGEESGLDLNLRTHQSSELYGILDNHDIDVALVFYHLYYKNIVCQQIFQERLLLVQSARPAIEKPLVHTEELDVSRELFLKWDDNYQLWHNQWLTNYGRPAVILDTIALARRVWQAEKGHWMIAPESVVCELARYQPVYVSELKNPPPDRRCYKISHRFPLASSEQALALFEQRLTLYLEGLRFRIPLGEVWSAD